MRQTPYKVKYKGRILYKKDMRPIASKILSRKTLTRVQKAKWKAWQKPLPYKEYKKIIQSKKR